MKLGLALLGIALVVPAADWLRFRGPNGSGVAEGARLPVEIGPGKNVELRSRRGQPLALCRSEFGVAHSQIVVEPAQRESALRAGTATIERGMALRASDHANAIQHEVHRRQ